MRLAVIPARGGSKGIPKKNLALVGGETLLARCIRTCREVCRVIVSTDCPDIATEAERCGAQVVCRPDRLATDTATSQDVIRHVLSHEFADEVVFAQCTSPFLHADDIRGCLEKLPTCDLAVCCVPFDGMVLDGEGKFANLAPFAPTLRQLRPPQYLSSGNCWAFRASYLDQPWMSGKVGIHLARFPYRLEIDSPEDLELARDLLHRHG
jgi:CMP-N-acetylneuraminic acid synthetase